MLPLFDWQDIPAVEFDWLSSGLSNPLDGKLMNLCMGWTPVLLPNNAVNPSCLHEIDNQILKSLQNDYISALTDQSMVIVKPYFTSTRCSTNEYYD